MRLILSTSQTTVLIEKYSNINKFKKIFITRRLGQKFGVSKLFYPRYQPGHFQYTIFQSNNVDIIK